MSTELSVSKSFLPTPTTFEEAWRLSQVLADSDMVPKDFKGKPGNCMIAMQWGSDLGIPGIQALQNIAVINGRPSIWGDAAKALVIGRSDCDDIQEFFEGEGDNLTAVCVTKRKGRSPVTSKFSLEDAKAAGLIGKQGPWTQYRNRMLQMRARGFALRDAFPDALRGLSIAEEAQDIVTEKDIQTGEVTARPTNQEPVKPALEYCTNDNFSEKSSAWCKLIESGKKTPEEVIAMVETRYLFTEEQKEQIRSWEKVDEAA